MKKILILGSFFVGNIAIMLGVLLFFVFYLPSGSAHNAQAQDVDELPLVLPKKTPYLSFGVSPITPAQMSEEITSIDSRPQIVDNFFKRYDSPMYGLGKFVVDTADKHKIPFNIVPAIGHCEGNLGKVVPENSFNTWGYGIYAGNILKFKSWKDGVEQVSKGLKKNYYDMGLDTPKEIMKKYTPPSRGSWADCVEQYLSELQ